MRFPVTVDTGKELTCYWLRSMRTNREAPVAKERIVQEINTLQIVRSSWHGRG